MEEVKKTKSKMSSWPVLLYVPNLIGYTRILLLIVCYFIKDQDYLVFAAIYFVSFVLDFFDGFFARLCNQCSEFGGILDMLTDRIGTLILYIVIFELFVESKYKCLKIDTFSALHGKLLLIFWILRSLELYL